jgi:acyl-CoA reductase-like NAD-dependent aldehyde dehydrogenase
LRERSVGTEAVLTLSWQTIAGSGFVATVLLLALVERLRRTFATRQELNGLGDRMNALQSLYLQVREAADEARDRAVSAQAEQKHQWERVAEQVIRPLERITEKLESVSEIQAAQTASLEHIGRWLDRTNTPNQLTRRER